MSNSTVGITGVGQLAVTVADVDRATTFYRDVLGIPLLFKAPGMAFLDGGGVRLMLAVPEGPEGTHGTSIIYYRVADINGAHQALEARSVPAEHPPRCVHRTGRTELWIAGYRDSEGNLFCIMQERAFGV